MADKKTLDRLLRVRSLQLNLVRADEARAQAKLDSEQALKARIAALADNVAPAPEPSGALALTRPKQVNIEGWADKRREAEEKRKK